jgi:putative multicomponent Na+:H+ antiporter subunit B
MNEWIGIALQLLLIVIAISIVFHKENFTIIILISAFGLIAATLYAINQAPDVAIAEVAIGSAIIPLIYVISISRQREFIVLDRVDHNRFELDTENILVYELLTAFVEKHDLKMNVCSDIAGSDKELTKELNVDLIIIYDDKEKAFMLKGKSSSVLMKSLTEIVEAHAFIKVVGMKDGDLYD